MKMDFSTSLKQSFLISALLVNRPNCRQVLDCASPSAFAARQSAAPARRRLALSAGRTKSVEGESGRGLPHSRTLRVLHPPSSILVASERSEGGFHSRVFISMPFN